MIDRSHVGFTTTPTTVIVDGWRVRLFCEATGETDPVHVDEGAAHTAGHSTCPVPTTYLKVLENEHFNAARVLQYLGVPLRGVLHGEQSFDVRKPVHVGDRVEIDRRIADIVEKKNGMLTIITLDTHFRLHGAEAATSRQTIVVRNTVSLA
jgi:acyl dehydratase